MRACHVPAPATVMLCPAMLLLALLASSPAAAVAAMNTSTPCAPPSCGNYTVALNTSAPCPPASCGKNHTAALNTSTTPCAPASCGNISISYPFWLAGTHPPDCGYKAFQVTCDNGNVSLTKSFLMSYQILDIFYPNNSFRVINVNLMWNDTCDQETLFNVSSDLGLSPFKISPKNQELFLYDCDDPGERQIPPSWTRVPCFTPDGSPSSVFASLGEKYAADGAGMSPPSNCTASMVPVLPYEGATSADYQRLMKEGGFLLEYPDDDGACADCTDSGGQCRVNASSDAFECHCRDGDDWFICGEYVYAYDL